MANNCFYDMKVRGKPDAIDELVRVLKYEHDKWHFCRIFSADVWFREHNEMLDEDIACICGDCAWSVAVCMTDCDWSYIQEMPEAERVTLQNVSEWLSLEIELWSEEGCEGFQEHFHYKNGEELVNECFDDFVEAFWNEEYYPTFAEFAQAIGHPEATEDELEEGWYYYKHDPVYSF